MRPIILNIDANFIFQFLSNDQTKEEVVINGQESSALCTGSCMRYRRNAK